MGTFPFYISPFRYQRENSNAPVQDELNVQEMRIKGSTVLLITKCFDNVGLLFKVRNMHETT